MARNYPAIPWCRYVDDAIAHCKTEQQAQQLLAELKLRYEECGFELHPNKTKIIYCKDGSRKRNYTDTQLDFLGYTFRRRKSKNTKRNSIFVNFILAASKTALKSMRAKIRRSNIGNRTDISLSGSNKKSWLSC